MCPLVGPAAPFYLESFDTRFCAYHRFHFIFYFYPKIELHMKLIPLEHMLDTIVFAFYRSILKPDSVGHSSWRHWANS